MNPTGKGGFGSRPWSINRKGRPKRVAAPVEQAHTAEPPSKGPELAELLEADRAEGLLPAAPAPVQTEGLRDISELINRKPWASSSTADPALEELRRRDWRLIHRFDQERGPTWPDGIRPWT